MLGHQTSMLASVLLILGAFAARHDAARVKVALNQASSPEPELDFETAFEQVYHAHDTEVTELKAEIARLKHEATPKERYDPTCYNAGPTMAQKDASCQGALVCARTGYDSRNFGDCGELHCCSEAPVNATGPSFRKISNEDEMPSGWQLATKEEVEEHKDEVVALIDPWEICSLAGGFKINGTGYGNQIQEDGGHLFGHLIIMLPAAKSGVGEASLHSNASFQKVDTTAPIPHGWHLATQDEVTAHREEVVALIDPWEICKLAGGFKINGSGYGNEIQEHSESEFHGHQIIMVGAVVATSGAKTSFKKVNSEDAIPAGWHLATSEEVTAHRDEVAALIDPWEICGLAGHHKVDGSGYGNKIQEAHSEAEFSHKIIMIGAAGSHAGDVEMVQASGEDTEVSVMQMKPAVVHRGTAEAKVH